MRVVLLLLWLVISAAAEERAAPPPSAKDIEKLYLWFDRLPIPKVKGRKYVRIWNGGRTVVANGKKISDTTEGFLLHDGGSRFQVVFPDFTVTTMEKEGARPGEESFVGYREISLEQEARHLIPKLGNKEVAEAWAHAAYNDRLGRTAQVFSMARLCALRGHRDLAKALLARLGALRRVMPNSRAYEPLETELQEDFAELLEWNAIRGAPGKGLTRTDLLAQFRRIEALCPAAEFVLKRVREEVARLEEQVKEDAAHSAVSDAEYAALSPADQAVELVYRLRDETGRSGGEWPYADSHEPMPSNGSNVGLLNLGFEAVPALVAALDQKGDTRSVMATKRYGGGAWLISIHDVAIAALSEIAGIGSYWQVPNWGTMKRAGSEPAVRKQIEDWWRDVRQKGEEAYLVGKLSTEGNAFEVGRRLLTRYPENGAREIVKAAEASTDGRQRSQWIKLLWKHDTPECRAFFERELRGGPTLGNRVAAAYGLRLLGDLQAEVDDPARWKRIANEIAAVSELEPKRAFEIRFGIAAE